MAADNIEIFGHLLGYGAAIIATSVAFYSAKQAKAAAESANKIADDANAVAKMAIEISKKNISATIDLEYSRLRDKWISELREEMAQFLTTATHSPISKKDAAELKLRVNRIMMRFPKGDLKAVRIRDAMDDVFKTQMDPEHLSKELFSDVCREVLKHEWDDLQKNLLRYREK